MRFAEAIGAVACLAALTGCDKSFHLMLRNDVGRPIGVTLGSDAKTIAPGASRDFKLGGDRRFRVEAGAERWDYGRSWLSGDFFSFNAGDYRFVRSSGFWGPSTVYTVLEGDGQIFVRSVVDNRQTDERANPQPEGYPLTPAKSGLEP